MMVTSKKGVAALQVYRFMCFSSSDASNTKTYSILIEKRGFVGSSTQDATDFVPPTTRN
jgi:hypothetical protein